MSEAPCPPLSAAERLAIEDLYARYNWALDTGDVEGFVEVFAEGSCVTTHLGGKVYTYLGRDGAFDLAEGLRMWSRFPGCQHYDGQQRFAPFVEANQRGCRVRGFNFIAECRTQAPHQVRYAGHADDRVVWIDGRWLFTHRHIDLWTGDMLRRFPGQRA